MKLKLAGIVVAVLLLAGCSTTEAKRPPADRPLPREYMSADYSAIDGQRRPIEIAYIAGGKGSDLYVFVHGMNTNADSWARVLGAFADRGRVLALDLPGCGWSEVPEDFSYDAVGLSDVVSQVVNAAPELAGLPPRTKPVLVGASLGGALITHAVLEGTIKPRALVLAAPAGFPMRLPMFIELNRGPLGPLFTWIVAQLPMTTLADLAVDRPEAVTEDLGQMLHAQLRDPERRRASYLTARNAINVEMAKKYSSRFAEIEVPALVVFGRNDEILPPEHLELWRENLPQCEGFLLEDCGHAVLEEQPERFMELTAEFLGWPAYSEASR